MTEQEIVEQQALGPTCYLMQVGMFIHAYEGAAFAMHRLTGYKVRLVHRKKGDIRMLGFQATQLENVKNLMAEAGITLRDEAQGFGVSRVAIPPRLLLMPLSRSPPENHRLPMSHRLPTSRCLM